MKKLFKTMAVAIFAIVAACACAFAVAGCKDKKSDDGNGDANTSDAYIITIMYDDGTPVNGQTDGKNGGKVIVQVCDGDACANASTLNIYPDANGKITITEADVEELHGKKVEEVGFTVLEGANFNQSEKLEVTKTGSYEIKVTRK